MNNSTPHAPNSTQKMKMESLDMTQENIKKIGALFPNVITETKDENGKLIKAINFDKLKMELANEVVDNSEESYDFTWVGKNEAIVEANTPIRKTLRPITRDEVTPTGKDNNGNPYCSSGSKNFENTENLYIEGDNLDVLKLLQESYLDAVKMIYIDPPYNTGNDFIYNDNFHTSKDKYDKESGMYDDEGNRQFVQNNDTNPRFHSDWCSMMYPRLRLARNLLTDDGVIFISIDDNEVGNLTKICEEVFGADSVEKAIWNKEADGSSGTLKQIHTIKRVHEYLMVVYKNKYKTLFNKVREPLLGKETELQTANLAVNVEKEKKPHSNYFKITNPSGDIFERQWKWSKEYIDDLILNGLIYWGSDGHKQPRLIIPTDDRRTTFLKTILNYGGTTVGRKDFEALMGEIEFSYPKPTILLKKIIETSTNNSDIILDFFSGSATTAHAVMQLNAEDNARQAGTGNRKFICVQLPETCDEKSEAFKAGYKNICEIGKERIRRAGEKIKTEIEENNAQLKLGEQSKQVPDIGFRVLKLDDSNMKDVYYSAGEYTVSMLDDLISNIKDDRTDIDLLYGVLLDWGLQLTNKHEILDIDGVRVHNYDDLSLVACFENNISESVIRKIADMKNSLGMSPLRVVFRDSSFANSPDKINVAEIFKLNAPNTSVKVI